MTTTTVFLSGSRQISRLNDSIKARLKKMIEQEFQIVVGDANGADKALQGYLAKANYHNVVVFCAGDTCRNNVGGWQVRNIEVASRLKGREFYAEKDKAMASQADYGFVLWDGRSSGSIGTILELMKNGKPVIVYFGPEKTFYPLKQASDVRNLLQHCDIGDYRSMNSKMNFDRRLRDLDPVARQGMLTL